MFRDFEQVFLQLGDREMDYKNKIIELINGISNTAKLEYLYYVIRSFLKG